MKCLSADVVAIALFVACDLTPATDRDQLDPGTSLAPIENELDMKAALNNSGFSIWICAS